MNKDINVQFVCKDCERYNLCKYYHNRKEDSYICKNFHLPNILEKIRAEIKEWYWQADKQALAKDPCVVDAMVDLFIRTIDKYKEESEVDS